MPRTKNLRTKVLRTENSTKAFGFDTADVRFDYLVNPVFLKMAIYQYKLENVNLL